VRRTAAEPSRISASAPEPLPCDDRQEMVELRAAMTWAPSFTAGVSSRGQAPTPIGSRLARQHIRCGLSRRCVSNGVRHGASSCTARHQARIGPPPKSEDQPVCHDLMLRR
jgi:hypothetical protein